MSISGDQMTPSRVNYPDYCFTFQYLLSEISLKLVYLPIKCLTSNRNDDPAGIRWINSDLIGFTCKMKNIRTETDTTKNVFFEGVLYFGWPNQLSSGIKKPLYVVPVSAFIFFVYLRMF